MKKLTTAKANHSQLEKVGTLTKGESAITIWRGKRKKYFVEANGQLMEYQKTSLEEWVEERLKEGYKLGLELEKVDYRDLNVLVGGVPLRKWYEKVLAFGYNRYSEDQCVRLWYIHKTLDEAIADLETIEEWLWLDGWNGWTWETLLKWEKEKLKEFFAKVMTDVWRYSWEVIRFVLSDKPRFLAKCPDWRKGKFSQRLIEEAMMRIDRKGLKEIVKNLVEGENQKWKEWLGRQVWLNLAEEMME